MQSRERPNKCNQCDFASSQVGNLGRHLQTDSGGKPNKCNGCGYAFCNQCDFASSEAGDLRRHFKTHSAVEKSKRNATKVTGRRFEETFETFEQMQPM